MSQISIGNNADLFNAAARIADGLERCGRTGDADTVRRALRISTVPGEILGELRLVLQSSDRVSANCAAVVDIDTAMKYLDRVL